MNDERTETIQKKPFYKRWWFWGIAVLIILAIIGNTDDEVDYISDTENGVYESEPALTEDEYKAGCEMISYTDIARNPQNYKGIRAVFRGEVAQVMENGNDVVLRVSVTEGDFGIWTDTIYVDYTRKSSNESRILEEDIITMYGEIKGLKSYTAVLGNEVSIPHFVAKYIEIN